MNITLKPGPAVGVVEAIPSKSHLHRLLICASLSNKGAHLLFEHSHAEDIKATVDCLSALGAKIETLADGFLVTPIDRKNLPDKAVLPCMESASTLRFMLPVVCALGISGDFKMSSRLSERPLAPLDTELSRHGIHLSRHASTLCCEGQLTAGEYALPGNISSQYISGLLFALPLLQANSTLTVTPPIESAGYIAMTLQAIEAFGMFSNKNSVPLRLCASVCKKGKKFFVEGDWSNAAFWLCAGAMPGGNIELTGLDGQSTQGDREICAILEKMGVNINWKGEVLRVSEGKRRSVEIDARAIPDLIPALCAVAAVSSGETIVKNAGRLRLKESDRLAAVAQTLNALGANITEETDGLRVQGVPRLKTGTVDAQGDHRIAMMAAIASLACDGPVTITGAQVVKKSYPAFWEKFRGVTNDP